MFFFPYKAIDNPVARLFDMISHGDLRLGFVAVFQAKDDAAVL